MGTNTDDAAQPYGVTRIDQELAALADRPVDERWPVGHLDPDVLRLCDERHTLFLQSAAPQSPADATRHLAGWLLRVRCATSRLGRLDAPMDDMVRTLANMLNKLGRDMRLTGAGREVAVTTLAEVFPALRERLLIPAYREYAQKRVAVAETDDLLEFMGGGTTVSDRAVKLHAELDAFRDRERGNADARLADLRDRADQGDVKVLFELLELTDGGDNPGHQIREKPLPLSPRELRFRLAEAMARSDDPTIFVPVRASWPTPQDLAAPTGRPIVDHVQSGTVGYHDCYPSSSDGVRRWPTDARRDHGSIDR